MPPTVSKAKASYPIFGATFASNKPALLLVGGGGGSGNHGILNKISLFDFSSRAPTVEPIAELEASKDDSVTCLANLATKDGVILYAGINSSGEDRSRARNEHFRSFEVQFPTAQKGNNNAEKGGAKIDFLSKSMLFTPPQSTLAAKEAYQRLVRLSPPQRTASSTPNKRIGAIASSLAGDQNEMVIFSATSTKPDIIERVSLPKGQEANDLDIFDQGNGRFNVVYALDHEVYTQDIDYDFDLKKSKGKNERRKLYTIPQDLSGTTRSKLRCIRWLTPKHVLLVANKPNRSGVDLLVLHNYEEGPSSVVVRKTLPKHIKSATDMDVALLNSDADGAYQIAVAIGATDISLSIYTMEYHGPTRDSVSNLHSFNSYSDVHDVQMTKVVFSPIHQATTTGPRYLRLASTSLGNTISVETFELQKAGSRHVLQTARSRYISTAATYLLGAMVVGVIAILLQSLLDPEGSLTKGILPSSLQGAAGQHKTFGESLRDKRHAAVLNDADSPVVKTSHRIADLLHLHLPHVVSESSDSAPPVAQKAVIIRADPETEGTLSTEVHDDHEVVLQQHTEAKKWDDLTKEEKKLWKKELQDAGMWAVGEGETILKSIFFGQIGGIIGQAAQGVLNG